MRRQTLPRRLYRLVRTDPPTVHDFLSQAALLKPPPLDTAAFRREWEGLSMFDSPGPLRKLGKARRWRLGEFIAELEVPDDVRSRSAVLIARGIGFSTMPMGPCW